MAGKLGPLLAEQRQLEERRGLLQSLLRSFEATGPNGSGAETRGAGSVARYVVERAVEILREEGGPLHINHIHARFVERGFNVPGAGKPVNLTVHLRSSEEIVSPIRGVYCLPGQAGDLKQQVVVRVQGKRSRTVRRRKS